MDHLPEMGLPDRRRRVRLEKVRFLAALRLNECLARSTSASSTHMEVQTNLSNCTDSFGYGHELGRQSTSSETPIDALPLPVEWSTLSETNRLPRRMCLLLPTRT